MVQNPCLFQKMLYVAGLEIDYLKGHLPVDKRVLGEVDDAGRAMAEDVQLLIFAEHSKWHGRGYL